MIFKIVEDFEKNTSCTKFNVLSADDAEQMIHGEGEMLESFSSYPQADAFVALLLEEERRTFYDKLLKREKKEEKRG
jgi:hypothetical protein